MGWEPLPSLSCVCGPACVAVRGPVHEPRSGIPHGSPGRAARARAASHCAPRPPSAAGDTPDMAQDYCGRPCGVCARGSLPARTNSAGCAVAPRPAVRRPPTCSLRPVAHRRARTASAAGPDGPSGRCRRAVLEGPQGHPACGEPGILTCGSIWGARRRGGRETRRLRERWRPGQDWALAQLHLDRLPQILEEMPAVCYLDGIWGTLCHPKSVRIGAVPRDHVTSGCARSHAATVSAKRSSRSATGRPRSRSTTIVP